MVRYLVILFVRMWVEITIRYWLQCSVRVILFVRMWVEMMSVTPYASALLSSSSWGCELKYDELDQNLRRIRHPLREDVSWNSWGSVLSQVQLVILFVRMWVEMHISNSFLLCLSSSSSWGCELKYVQKNMMELIIWVILFVRMRVEISVLWILVQPQWCHPLREDVSWNIPIRIITIKNIVILFVRMWVEMLYTQYTIYRCHVILFVRMWVEILKAKKTELTSKSSSSWGCELK